MIFTRFGVPVKITKRDSHETSSLTQVFVEATDDSKWSDWRQLHELKADGGFRELTEAASVVPISDDWMR